MWEAVWVGVDHVSSQDGEGSPPYGAPHALRAVVLVLPLCTNKKTNEKTEKFPMSIVVDLELDPDPEPELHGCRPTQNQWFFRIRIQFQIKSHIRFFNIKRSTVD